MNGKITLNINRYIYSMRYLLAVLLFTFHLATHAQTPTTHVEAWQKDLEFLKTELPHTHPDFFTRVKRADWNAMVDIVKNNLAGKTDAAIALDLQQVIAAMGDDHTNLDYEPLFKVSPRFPFRSMAFADGYFVIGTIEPYQKILGKKIVAIDGMPIDSVEKKLSMLTSRTNNALIKYRVSGMLTEAAMLFYFGVIKGNEAVFKFSDASGKEDTLRMNLQQAKAKTVKIDLPTMPLYLSNERSLFWSTVIKESGIVYMQYNRCDSKEIQEKYGSKERAAQLPSFDDFTIDLLEKLKQPGEKKLVIDLRFNPGGGSEQGSQLAKKLVDAKFNKKGKTFVIIGARTFSSAVLNALDFWRIDNAILVGEETSGKPNHFGAVEKLKLPNTGMTISHSTKFFNQSEKDTNSLEPEINTPQTFADFSAGVDNALQAIEKY